MSPQSPPSEQPQPTGRGPASLAALPTEIQAEILSYLSWESHLPCMQVCTLWQSLLSDAATLKSKRFVDGAGAPPRRHLIFVKPFGAIRFRTAVDRVRYTTLSPANIEDFTEERWEIPLEIRAIWALTLENNGILADPVFYPTADDAKGGVDGEVDYPKDIGLRLVAKHTYKDDIWTLQSRKWSLGPDAELEPAEQRPDFLQMSIRQFVQFAADFAMETTAIRDSASKKGQVEMELHFDEDGDSDWVCGCDKATWRRLG
ncbi:hypothetical protein TWF696_008100 [Orbilia brochopaga]|uniref:F-box domain-containing protein n=1 Tax=Orbilia brochopaga TaxID=3140254 RepID=A0AAV9URM5_9PEZI